MVRLQTLEKELAAARISLEEVVAKRAGLVATIGQVCDDLRVPSIGALDPPSARALQIMA